MKKVLFVKNISREPPGLLEELLREWKIDFDIIDLSRKEPLPDPRSYAALVVMGGPQSANDATPHIQSLVAFVRDWIRQEKPYLGICLGMQILVKACGGNVFRHSKKEIGFLNEKQEPYNVALTAGSDKDPIFKNLPKVMDVFQLHGETVELPASMILLGTGKDCKHQIVRAAKVPAYGFQCHFELTGAMLDGWQKEDEDLSQIPLAILKEQFRKIRRDYDHNASVLFHNFLKTANLINERQTTGNFSGNSK